MEKYELIHRIFNPRKFYKKNSINEVSSYEVYSLKVDSLRLFIFFFLFIKQGVLKFLLLLHNVVKCLMV